MENGQGEARILIGSADRPAGKPHKLPAPEQRITREINSWEDLWGPAFKGKVAFPVWKWMGEEVFHHLDKLAGGAEDNIDPGIAKMVALFKENDRQLIENVEHTHQNLLAEEVWIGPHFGARTEQERVREMLDIVGLPGVEARHPRPLSGGQRQRVALARATVIHPPVLLLDEPLSNLDALLRKQMRSELRAIQRRIGITAIYVTHDQDEAFEMSDRVILLNHGSIEQIGTPETLYDRPATRFAAEFIGDANLIEGEVVESANGIARIRSAGAGTIPANARDADLAVGSAVYLVVRPERIQLNVEPPSEGTALEASITERAFAGENVRITLATDGGATFRCIKPSLPMYRRMQRGDRIWALPEECHAIPRG